MKKLSAREINAIAQRIHKEFTNSEEYQTILKENKIILDNKTKAIENSRAYKMYKKVCNMTGKKMESPLSFISNSYSGTANLGLSKLCHDDINEEKFSPKKLPHVTNISEIENAIILAQFDATDLTNLIEIVKNNLNGTV